MWLYDCEVQTCSCMSLKSWHCHSSCAASSVQWVDLCKSICFLFSTAVMCIDLMEFHLNVICCFSPLFDHDQKSNNINRCLIGQNRLCQIQDSASSWKTWALVTTSFRFYTAGGLLMQIPSIHISDTLQIGWTLSYMIITSSYCFQHYNVKSLLLYNYKDVSL